MFVICILFVMLIASLRLEAGDRSACVSYALLSIGHELFLSEFPGSWYCLSDATIYAVLAIVFSYMPYSDRVFKLIIICIISISLDFCAWFLWWLYLPVTLINGAYILLYIAAALITSKGARNGRYVEHYIRCNVPAVLVCESGYGSDNIPETERA